MREDVTFLPACPLNNFHVFADLKNLTQKVRLLLAALAATEGKFFKTFFWFPILRSGPVLELCSTRSSTGVLLELTQFREHKRLLISAVSNKHMIHLWKEVTKIFRVNLLNVSSVFRHSIHRSLHKCFFGRRRMLRRQSRLHSA